MPKKKIIKPKKSEDEAIFEYIKKEAYNLFDKTPRSSVVDSAVKKFIKGLKEL